MMRTGALWEVLVCCRGPPRLIQHGEVLPQTAALGTVPVLELSRIVLLRVLLR
jgi:hypothetical protein